MSIYVLAGPGFNFLNRFSGASYGIPGSDSVLGLPASWDYFTDRAGKLSAAAASQAWGTDLSMVVGGDFEAWNAGVPFGWTVSGTVTQDTVVFNTGLSSAKLAAGASVSQILSPARAAEVLGGLYAIRGDGTGTLSAYLQDLDSGNWWNGASWQASKTTFAVQTAAAWAGPTAANPANPTAVQIPVEGFLATLQFLPNLQLTFQNTAASGFAWVDSVAFFPGISWLSFHGHNIGPATPVTLQTSWNNAWAGEQITQGTMVLLHGSPYLALPNAVFVRYVRAVVTGTPYQGALWSGETVIGQYIALASGVAMDGSQFQAELDREMPQVRNLTIAKSIFPQNLSPSQDPPRRVIVTFRPISLAQYQDIRDNIYLRSQSGGFPLIIAPADYDAELCVMGFLTANNKELQDFTLVRELPVEVDETPFPIVTA